MVEIEEELVSAPDYEVVIEHHEPDITILKDKLEKQSDESERKVKLLRSALKLPPSNSKKALLLF